MKKTAFISRHAPTEEQSAMAQGHGFLLVPVGDKDGFDSEGLAALVVGFDAVCVVHAGAAMNLILTGIPVIIFENGMRPVEGGAPQFYPQSMRVFRVKSMDSNPSLWMGREKLE